jgi:hypothetical protein
MRVQVRPDRAVLGVRPGGTFHVIPFHGVCRCRVCPACPDATVCTEWCGLSSHCRSWVVTKPLEPGGRGRRGSPQVNLDEGFPVVVALVQVHLVELIAGKRVRSPPTDDARPGGPCRR